MGVIPYLNREAPIGDAARCQSDRNLATIVANYFGVDFLEQFHFQYT